MQPVPLEVAKQIAKDFPMTGKQDYGEFIRYDFAHFVLIYDKAAKEFHIGPKDTRGA